MDRRKQCSHTLPLSLRSRNSAASINICTIPIAAIFNNNTDIILTIRPGTPWLYTTCSQTLQLLLLLTLSWFRVCQWLFQRRESERKTHLWSLQKWALKKVKSREKAPVKPVFPYDGLICSFSRLVKAHANNLKANCVVIKRQRNNIFKVIPR